MDQWSSSGLATEREGMTKKSLPLEAYRLAGRLGKPGRKSVLVSMSG
jgi:hypothetical protein